MSRKVWFFLVIFSLLFIPQTIKAQSSLTDAPRNAAITHTIEYSGDTMFFTLDESMAEAAASAALELIMSRNDVERVRFSGDGVIRVVKKPSAEWGPIEKFIINALKGVRISPKTKQNKI